ncbi:hypothetical protein [uncultured Microbulbifer sp.]|uniref:hypothetical protein n=1 Tax=uncultured Microbulbifer sp. TaxID=348147 RepID=UPI0026164E3F|nr:hypothetical protein [uncultured Microbulbifer sp.]
MLKSALTALLLLALSACGGGGGSSSSSSSTGGSVSKTFSSSVTAVDIRRKDSGDSLPVSGLPGAGAEITLSE